ncbi:MAG: hypothetical protein LBJ17_08050, partial [Dysgonamonadaceae bacterium]|nr:hypothetical protein [Dysgonamonadaceae bacterium]
GNARGAAATRHSRRIDTSEAHRIQNIESAVETASSYVPAAAEQMKRYAEFRVIRDRNYRNDFEKLMESTEKKQAGTARHRRKRQILQNLLYGGKLEKR